MTKAVIDADFFIKLTKEELSARLFLRIMDEMNMSPIMHKYVYIQELKHAQFIRDLVEKNQIQIYNYSDYLKTEQDRKEYEKYFLDAYNWLTGEDFAGNTEQIYTYHAEDENLGEIRSIYLALKEGIPYFASDDRGAEKFVKHYISTSHHSLETITVIEAIQKCVDNGSTLRWQDLKCCIPAAYRDDMKTVERIKQIVDVNRAYKEDV